MRSVTRSGNVGAVGGGGRGGRVSFIRITTRDDLAAFATASCGCSGSTRRALDFLLRVLRHSDSNSIGDRVTIKLIQVSALRRQLRGESQACNGLRDALGWKAGLYVQWEPFQCPISQCA